MNWTVCCCSSVLWITMINAKETGHGFTSITLWLSQFTTQTKFKTKTQFMYLFIYSELTQNNSTAALIVHFCSTLGSLYIILYSIFNLFSYFWYGQYLSLHLCVLCVWECLNLGDVIVQFVPRFGAIRDLHTSLCEWSGKEKYNVYCI